MRALRISKPSTTETDAGVSSTEVSMRVELTTTVSSVGTAPDPIATPSEVPGEVGGGNTCCAAAIPVRPQASDTIHPNFRPWSCIAFPDIRAVSSGYYVAACPSRIRLDHGARRSYCSKRCAQPAISSPDLAGTVYEPQIINKPQLGSAPWAERIACRRHKIA